MNSWDRLPLRERKKLKTRRAIQEHALRLFEDRGYDATTVEQIAEAAEVSPSTFFRYFPTKEDVVLTDEYDPLIGALFQARPADEEILTVLEVVMGQVLGELYEQDSALLLTRIRLIQRVPALRARSWDQAQHDTHSMLVRLMGERLGRDPGDPELRMFAAAVMGVLQEVVMDWATDEGRRHLPTLIGKAFAFLRSGLRL